MGNYEEETTAKALASDWTANSGLGGIRDFRIQLRCDRGMITEAEFADKRKDLLNRT